MLQSVQNHVNGLFKHQLLGPIPSISESVHLGQGLIICIPNTSLEDADAVGSGTTLCEPLSQCSHPSPRSLELCALFLEDILQGSVDCGRISLSFSWYCAQYPDFRFPHSLRLSLVVLHKHPWIVALAALYLEGILKLGGTLKGLVKPEKIKKTKNQCTEKG